MQDMVLVINQNDSQTQAIIKKLRAEQIYAEMAQGDISLAQIQALSPGGIIVSGGVTGEKNERFDAKWLMAGLPVLALGDAALSLLTQLGGSASEGALAAGIHPVKAHDCPILAKWDGDESYLHDVYRLNLTEMLLPALSVNGDCIAFQHASLPLYGLQLHIEQNDLEAAQVLIAFATDVCNLTRWWDSDAMTDRAISLIRERAGTDTVLCELTGGVDSGVCAALGHMAVGPQLACYFVDTGLLREKDREEALSFFQNTMGLSLFVVEAKERFLEALDGLSLKDEKQKVIYSLLRDIRLEQKERTNAKTLLRAVNANDLMQGAEASTDETVLTPIAQWFKNEVRRMGEELGLPPHICQRQPFPETGLALRIGGGVTNRRAAVLRKADDIWQEEIEKSGQSKKLWQYYAMILPLNDDYIVTLRAVNLVNGTEAQAARLPFELVETVTGRILLALPEVKRVLYDFTNADSIRDIEWP